MVHAAVRVLGLTVAAIAAAAPGAGATDWSAPQELSVTPVGPVRLAADDSGAAVLAWGEIAGSGQPSQPLHGELRIAMRPAGGRFTAPTTLSSTRDDGRAFALAVGAGGTAIAVWRVQPAPPGRLRVAIGRAGHGFGVHATLRDTGSLPRASNAGGRAVASDPVLAVAADGSAIVAWLARGRAGCGDVVLAAMRRPGQAFGPGRRISTACPHAWHPVAAMDADGGGGVAWRAGRKCNYGQPCDYTVDAAPIVRRRLLAPRTVSDGPVAALSPAAAAGGGRALVVWRDAAQVSRTGAVGRVLAAEARSGGRFGEPDRVSTSDRIAGIPQVSMDGGGRAAVSWYEGENPVSPAARVAVSGPGEPFGAPQELSPASLRMVFDPAPQIAWDGAGNALAAFPAVAPAPSPAPVPALWAVPGGSAPFALAPPAADGYQLGPVAVAGDGEVLTTLTRGNYVSSQRGLAVAIRPGPLTRP